MPVTVPGLCHLEAPASEEGKSPAPSLRKACWPAPTMPFFLSLLSHRPSQNGLLETRAQFFPTQAGKVPTVQATFLQAPMALQTEGHSPPGGQLWPQLGGRVICPRSPAPSGDLAGEATQARLSRVPLVFLTALAISWSPVTWKSGPCCYYSKSPSPVCSQ